MLLSTSVDSEMFGNRYGSFILGYENSFNLIKKYVHRLVVGVTIRILPTSPVAHWSLSVVIYTFH